MHNYTSIYLPKVYAYGKPITTFTELVKQQWRYNYGDTQFMMYYMKKMNNPNVKNRPLLTKIDYITHGLGMNYVSVILIMFTLLSVLVIFAAVSPSQITINQLLAAKYITTTMEILGISTFVVSILAPMILTKLHFKSFRKGFMVFLLNFGLSFVRAKAAIAAYKNAYPSSGWTKGDKRSPSGMIIKTVRNSFTEVSFSSVLIVLSFLALMINNAYGAIWLLWYGLLYASTSILFYKYG